MSDETMLEEIERLRVTVRDMWHERQATSPGTPGSLVIHDSEIAAEAHVDLDTVRAFLISEDGAGIVVKGDGGELSISTVELGYGE
jgi:ketopantoate hydroxymethyltransferase